MSVIERIQKAQQASGMKVTSGSIFGVMLTKGQVSDWVKDKDPAKKSLAGWVLLGDTLTRIVLEGSWALSMYPFGALSHPCRASTINDLDKAGALFLCLADSYVQLERFSGATAKATFFCLNGLSVSVNEGEREVASWKQIALQELGGNGAIALVKASGQEEYLLMTKSEPGNPSDGHVMVSASLQASAANIKKDHGGTLTPGADLISVVPVWARIPFDGGRFNSKVNQYGFVECRKEEVNLLPGQFWATLNDVRELYWAGLLNVHACIALLGAILGRPIPKVE